MKCINSPFSADVCDVTQQAAGWVRWVKSLSLGILSKRRPLTDFPLQNKQRMKNLHRHPLRRSCYLDGLQGAQGQTASTALH